MSTTTNSRKTYLIATLTLSAIALVFANVQLTPTARADQAVSSDAYQLVTGRTNSGDEALYILSRQKNLVAIFTWDEGRRSIAVRDVRSLDTILADTQRR